MRWDYCPFCGSIRLQKKENEYFCQKCGWHGIPQNGDMEEINAIAKKYKPGTNWIDNTPKDKEPSENNENQEKKVIQNHNFKKVPKNKKILEKLNGKSFGDAEIL